MIKKYAYYFLLSLFPCITLAVAQKPATPPSPPVGSLSHFEISAAGGSLRGHANNTHLEISPSETDSVLVSQVSRAALWRLGVGYSFFAEQLQKREFFNDFLVELNFYRGTQTTVSGSVWQYQLPQFNNYNFSAPVKSARVMIDLKPSLVTWGGVSPYPIIGLGVTRNTISFAETVTSPDVDPNSALTLSNHSDVRFAFDLGVGARMDLDKHIAASLEYLYTNLGSVAPSGTPSNSVALMSPPSFMLSNHTLLFGLSWKI